ncbi:Hypothetical predicted protein [Paramuricea clavata]|uniref:Uncharacterized protein n=1 Tax=Paramuricea clavata TaxID=317549 RepID=A0A7D9K0L0_PARCT|nr:Hypothetical predicted protein [Paramuricea clavata]
MKVQILFVLALFAVFYGQTQVQGCYSDSDCFSSFEKCCKPRWSSNECAYSCAGKSCNSNTDCGSEYCCNNVCRGSCSGYSCILDSDCGGYNEYCCNYTCKTGTCGLASWIVAVIVLCILGGVATIVGIVLCVYCSNRRRSPGLVVTAVPVATVPTTSMSMVASLSHDNYVQGPPPVYQDYQPPPVYQPPQP